MPPSDSKVVQSLIQGLLAGQTDIESGLVVLLDSPSWKQKITGWGLVTRGIGKMTLMRAAFFTHNPSFAGTNLTGGQAASLNTYYLTLEQLLSDADVDGGYVAFRDGVNQLQTDHAAIITTMKSKDQPSHGTKSLD